MLHMMYTHPFPSMFIVSNTGAQEAEVGSGHYCFCFIVSFRQLYRRGSANIKSRTSDGEGARVKVVSETSDIAMRLPYAMYERLRELGVAR